MDLNLSGKHALVCGASEGIGRATARELALLGADVTLLARREEALRGALASMPCTGNQRHGFVVADVAQTFELSESVAALAAIRPVHILITNPGGPPGGPPVLLIRM
jgi:3-oxoacyl-[acyl-carrier protein] reductase